MTHRLYRTSTRRADWSTAIIVVLFAGTALQRLLQGLAVSATVFAGIAGVVAVLRFIVGPLRGPALIEIGPSEIVFRQHFYIPARVQRVPLGRLASLEIAGGKGDRHFRFDLEDGTREEVRPRYGPLFEPEAVEFLTSHLAGRVPVVVEPPANWLARAHGNF